ncbi:MAG: phage virion morphogenesis protein [Thermomonas hydrothermalis]|uniref:phage virion morphogenesis protein n=1 Tax=Thermomonas hydrothermalis TaxID=213588 RepID=UPI002357868E|nr:phage virion morphogenesis protein [Thermomonas hydrothermalis]MCL6619725.1 phage virion morphogenesis protein [Thermomonas hydrothermalis]
MEHELQRLEAWAGALIGRLAPGERRRAAAAVATGLRRAQAQRIARQQNPDGSAYAPRKPRPASRGKAGRIRRSMFVRLRTATWLRQRATPEAAVVEFAARVQRIARVHQEGLVDAVGPHGPRVRYPRRVLLGFTREDEAMIRDLLLRHIIDRE